MKLRIYLLNIGMSMADFARLIGYTPTFIRNVISGYHKCSKRVAKLIEKMTDSEVTAEEVLGFYKEGEKKYRKEKII